ncbi:OsmC family protein [Plasticicumulans acidivorans]|uniref:Putative redox protein n=1 Tax=Plasticicumulans acidivorans TaxID=886464 RepID=A0A317MZU3_9GAMM|nr:OsmC family protein [Plasticicumulans acidivorans]PWV64636.1 putative redox protein [Plasticicumulans acidivorans]
MKVTVKWLDEMTFVGETESGHAVVMDAAPDVGGHNLGARPMEMLLLGTGGCSSIDVIHILKKARQAVSDCRCEVSAERAASDPKVFTRIHLHFVVSGQDLSENHVRRAVELSAQKYCSASIMFAQIAEVSHSYEISA